MSDESCPSGTAPSRTVSSLPSDQPTAQTVAPTPPEVSPGRRRFFASVSMIPVAAVGLSGTGLSATAARAASSADTSTSEAFMPYAPSFFNRKEWLFLEAACDRLIPSDEVGPGAIQSGVLEFLDRHMQTPYAAGDIWYMQGPFIEAASQFGYQGKLPLRDIMRVGITAFDAHCARDFGGKSFADLDHDDQEKLLKAAEAGDLKFDNISAKMFFTTLLNETRYGYFADPKHGGNKDMGAWKMIGYPGMRADYLDWVEVRDRPYALPPVDLAGRRG